MDIGRDSLPPSFEHLPLVVFAGVDNVQALERCQPQLKLDYIWIHYHNDIAPPQENVPLRQYAEHLIGPGAVLIDKITRWLPVLIIFDVQRTEIPWEKWLPLLKSAPATRRIPIVAISENPSHEFKKQLERLGANGVYSWRFLLANFSQVVEKHANIPDISGIRYACGAPISDHARIGIELFNQGEYFEAHEYLEAAWNNEDSPGREFYRYLLQVAVAYLQIKRQNFAGALKMFIRMRQWCAYLPPLCRGVDVDSLRKDVVRAYNHLIELGPAKINEFAKDYFTTIKYHNGVKE